MFLTLESPKSSSVLRPQNNGGFFSWVLGKTATLFPPYQKHIMLPDAKVLWGNFLGQGKNSRSTKDDRFGLRVVSKEYLSTRNLCIGVLFLGWTTSILCIVLGVYMIYVPLPLDSAFKQKRVDIGTCTYCFNAGFEGNGEFNHSGHRIYAMSKTVQLLVTLCLNTTTNVLLDCVGYIHATTLRWALVQENRLQMNSNLQFSFSSKTCFPNKWYMNAILIQTCVQSFICFSLHCIELLFNVSRDETVWRKAASVGIKTNPSPIKSFTNNWQSLVLMTPKSLIQWIFGYAFRADV
jgi:hypothetical protein